MKGKDPEEKGQTNIHNPQLKRETKAKLLTKYGIIHKQIKNIQRKRRVHFGCSIGLVTKLFFL